MRKLNFAEIGRWHISPARNLNGDNTKEIEVMKLIFWLFKCDTLPTEPKPFNSKTLCLQQLSNSYIRQKNSALKYRIILFSILMT
ncbi:hypothetical protein VCHA42O253_40003 [Vibrio chagasii]|nr:hypothetical protein VCHA42O253_40003 [Vibrio chagasii]